jgi:hypothetical protein
MDDRAARNDDQGELMGDQYVLMRDQHDLNDAAAQVDAADGALHLRSERLFSKLCAHSAQASFRTGQVVSRPAALRRAASRDLR